MQLARPELKKTVRRSKKKAEAEAAKSGLEPEGAEIKTVPVKPPNSTIAATTPDPKATSTTVTKSEEPKKTIPSAPSKTPTFVPKMNKEECDLESMATGSTVNLLNFYKLTFLAMAKKTPFVSDSVLKSEAGGVATKLKKLRAEKASSPVAAVNIEKSSPEKVDRGPRKYSARRKTEEIIPPPKVESQENVRFIQ